MLNQPRPPCDAKLVVMPQRRPAMPSGEYSMPSSPDLLAACTPVGAR
jgi:hypothetical protein